MKRLFPWLLSGLLLAPSAWWIATDRSVWSWDPAFYAMDTTDLWYLLANHPRQWPDRMISIFHAKAPGIGWLGQFFVPLGRWMGSVEIGLLTSVLLCQFVSLMLLYRLCRRLAPSSVLPAVAGTLLVAASPLFVAMSHHFLTEAIQLLSITYVLWIAVEATTLPPVRVLLHIVLAVVLGVLTKVSTPAYVVFPAGLALVRAMVALRESKTRPAFGASEIGLAVTGLVVGGFGLGWYLRNGRAVFAFAKLAASSDMALDYGSRRPFLDKLGTWLVAVSKTLFVPATAWALLFLVAAAGVVILRRNRAGLGSAVNQPAGGLMLLLLAQVVLVLAMMSTTINEETRYLLPLAPFFAATLTWILARLPSRRAVVLGLLIFAAQWVFVHARQLGNLPAEEGGYWSRAPVAEGAKMRDVEAVIRATCNEQTVGRWNTVGMNLDWLNHFTMMFYGTKYQLDHPGRCYYQYLGHAPKDPDEAMRLVGAMDGAYFISLEAAAMPKPPDFLNQISAEVVLRVERDPGFVRVPFESSSGIALYRRR